MPPGLDEAKQNKVTELILQRKQFEKSLAKDNEVKKNLDPAFTQNGGKDDLVTQHRIDGINDQIKSIAMDTPVKYFKQDDGFFKQFGEGKPEKIDENRYLAEKPSNSIIPEEVKNGESPVSVEERKAQNDGTDKKIVQFQIKFPEHQIDPLEDLPESVVRTFDRVDHDVPTDPVAINEASDWLYNKYKQLTILKESDTRRLTIPQIEAFQKQLGEDITLLESHKSKYHGEETPQETKPSEQAINGTNGGPADIAAEPTTEPAPKSAAKGKIKEENKRPAATRFTFGDLYKNPDGSELLAKDNPLHKDGTKVASSGFIQGNLKDGDKVKFYAEKERSGTWDTGKKAIVDENGNAWGTIAILNEKNGYIEKEPAETKNVSVPEVTSVSKEDVKAERIAAGKSDIERLKKTFPDVFTEGKRLVDSGELDPEAKAKEIIDKRTPISSEELAGLHYHKVKLKNQRNQILDKIDAKQTDGKNTERLKQHLALIEDLIDDNQQATSIATNESGRTTAYAAEGRGEDFSRKHILRTAKAKNNGRDISVQDKSILEDHVKKIEDLERKVSKLETEATKNAEQDLVKRVVRKSSFEEREGKRASTKAIRAKENEELRVELSKILKKQRSTLNSNPVPVEVIPVLGKLARNHIADGLTTLSSVVDKIYQDVKDSMEGISKEDISDAIKNDFNTYLADDNKERLGRSKERLSTKLTKIISGTYQTTKPRKLEVDKEYLRLRANINREQGLINKKLNDIEFANKSSIDKARTALVKWSRAAKLTGISTIGKLAAAGLTTAGLKIPEEIVGGAISKVLPKLAEKSNLQGGFSVKALAKGYTEGVMQGMKDSYDIVDLKAGGKSDLEALYGNKEHLPPEALEFFGHIHGAIKAPVKRAIFEYSLKKRNEAALRHGLNPLDPVIEAKNSLDAYEDANKSIFMGKNKLSEAYEQAVGSLERGGDFAKSAAALTRMLIPFVKVPTNIAKETGRLVFGAPVGLVQLGKAMAKGIDNATPEEADDIIKNLKVGSIGSAALIVGFLNPSNIGGYYQKHEKRNPNDIKAGGIKLFGENIPVWLTEHPIFQAMQVGATFRRVLDKTRHGENKNEAYEAASIATGKGMIEKVPLADQGIRLEDAVSSTASFRRFSAEFVKGNLDPAALREVAEYTDRKNWDANKLLSDQPKIKRLTDPKHGYWKTVYRHVASGVPGWRETLPKKE